MGATGGGFILSEGVRTKATIALSKENRIFTRVNGDRGYDARTTRRAVRLLLAENDKVSLEVSLRQTVGTPIGAGFGASGASATSAVYATAAAAGMAMRKEKLALCAHRAEILEQTGLGTVSVVFDAVGAGAIITPGEPGEAKFINVKVPKGIRLVTAFVAPYDKKEALSSRALSAKINRLGREALATFLADPTFDTLASEGERFSDRLGLQSPEVTKLIGLAKSSGANYASQNMIGYSVHSLVSEDSSRRVARALRTLGAGVRVDTFEVGSRRAGVLSPSRR